MITFNRTGWLAAYLRTPFTFNLPRSVCTLFWRFVAATAIYLSALLGAGLVINGAVSIFMGIGSSVVDFISFVLFGTVATLGGIFALICFVKWNRERSEAKRKIEYLSEKHPDGTLMFDQSDRFYYGRQSYKGAKHFRKQNQTPVRKVAQKAVSKKVRSILQYVASGLTTFADVLVAIYDRFKDKTCAMVDWETPKPKAVDTPES